MPSVQAAEREHAPGTGGAGAAPGSEEHSDPGARVMAALRALAHPARWRIMELIHRGGGEICVCEFQEHLDLSQPTISHHLKTLRDASLIESRQEGTWVYHTIRRGEVAEITGVLERWT